MKTKPEDAAIILKIAQLTGQLGAHVEYLDQVVDRVGAVADRHDITQLEIPANACSLAELADTLERFVDIANSITPSVRRLDAALPRPN
jgi:hypothetical protein